MSKGMEGGVSRRSFLKGAGVAAAALAGCASGSTGAASGDWLPKSWDYECDLLVIGYGGAGMWASLIGADECGQEVIVLEKAPVEGGGNSRINNGEWTIVEESDKERFKKYIKAFTHGKTPEPMIDAWVNECVRNTEYADKYGMTYEVSEVALAGAIPEYYFLDDNAYEGSCKLSSVDGFGMLSFRELDAQREKLGVQVLFDCHDERLIQNPETKEIVGAYTMIGSEEKTVKARKGVIMTTGGFEFNEDLKNAYLKCYPFKFEGWQFNTGDGIKMVEDVGAKLWHMDMAISMYSMWTRDPENDFSILYFMPANSYFNVNRLGKRYVNENNMGSPHNCCRSTTPSTTSTASRRGASSTRPASTPASCPPARAISSSAATSPATCPTRSAHGTAGARTTRLSWRRAGSSRATPSRSLARRSRSSTTGWTSTP